MLPVILFVLAVIGLAAWTLILRGRKELLDKREVALDAREEVIDNHQKALDADRKTLIERYREIAPWVNGEAYLFAVRYTVTDSDILKYNSDQAIRNIAKNRMGIVIANDLVKKFPNPKELFEDGRRVFEYRILMMEEKCNS